MTADDLKKPLEEDRDLLKTIIEETLQQVLEAEMDEALQASKGERTASRLGYRACYYNRMLVTRVGHRSALDSAGTAASSVAAATVLLDRQRAHANRTDQLQLV